MTHTSAGRLLKTTDDSGPAILVANTVPEMFEEAVRRVPDRAVIAYFDGELSYATLDRLATGFAHYLQAHGVVSGDRVAVQLQSSPHFVITVLGAWKAGCVIVPVNPMYRAREVRELLDDSGAVVVVCSEEGYAGILGDVITGTAVRVTVTTGELDFQTRNLPTVFGPVQRRVHAGVDDLIEVAHTQKPNGTALAVTRPEDLAVICYTSGTSGPPKGAMLTHANLLLGGVGTAESLGLPAGVRIFAMAPLFHITGLVVELVQSLILRGTLILPYRFVPSVALDLFTEYRPHFTVGPPTAYSALMATEGASREHLSSFTILLAGGAPLSPAVVDRFEEHFGHYIRNGYGLTETSAACVLMPPGQRGEVDDVTAALANGLPFPDVELRIVDEAGATVETGERGEILVRGPIVTTGYWRKPDETAAALRDGWFHTGDIGLLDDRHMLYVVDRIKDMIIASGFKVWPGEVESVLYQHPAVREAAVIGIEDPYRGQTVKAVVALQPGTDATADELTAWCRERMAAYKYPRVIEILPDLPKTSSGKILRRALRTADHVYKE
ncbi:class I adenylate-forming enzyme family protein [Rhodococcus sp. NPDC057014]|uniref:class I adenylate-forming enzyme family protein n=1 Tax=Rhodococcus sp. NPDC057014 TaxID=3346000 RepID=UPI0036264FAA